MTFTSGVRLLKAHSLAKLLSQWLQALVSKILKIKFVSQRTMSFRKTLYYKELVRGAGRKHSLCTAGASAWKWGTIKLLVWWLCIALKEETG